MEKFELKGKPVVCKEIAEDVWLVGWLFESKKSGKAMLQALADLYTAFDERQKKAPTEEQAP